MSVDQNHDESEPMHSRTHFYFYFTTIRAGFVVQSLILIVVPLSALITISMFMLSSHRSMVLLYIEVPYLFLKIKVHLYRISFLLFFLYLIFFQSFSFFFFFFSFFFLFFLCLFYCLPFFGCQLLSEALRMMHY